MPASPAQLEANRRNALRSTGPKTEAGKARSRMNALTHGLTGDGTVVPDPIAGRAEAYERDLIAEHGVSEHDTFGRFLASQAALAMARMEACPAVEADALAEQIDRAEHSWDLDRAVEVELLAARLAKQPSVVALRLLESSQGCDWLMDRWKAVANAIEAANSCDDAVRSYLADLLGIPADLRAGDPRVSPDRPAAELVALARSECDQIATLKAEVLDRRDARARARAAAGLAFDESAASRRLRGYEASCNRRLRWALDQLRRRCPSRESQAPDLDRRARFEEFYRSSPAPEKRTQSACVIAPPAALEHRTQSATPDAPTAPEPPRPASPAITNPARPASPPAPAPESGRSTPNTPGPIDRSPAPGSLPVVNRKARRAAARRARLSHA